MRAVPSHYGTTAHLAGRSHWTAGGSEWSSAPGSVSVKVPDEVVVERAREDGLKLQVVLFEPWLFDEARRSLGRSVARARGRFVDRRDPRVGPLLALHRRVLVDDSTEVLADAVCHALAALVDVLCAPAKDEPSVGLSAAVKRARALLDQRFTEPVDLDAIAAHARLDKFRLCRAFREQVGVPPHAYVTYRRIALAQDLLAQGMPQAEVAARVGFYDQSLLHRHFKRIVRVTPGAFARGHAGR